VQVFGKSFVKIKTKERLEGQQGTEKVNNNAISSQKQRKAKSRAENITENIILHQNDNQTHTKGHMQTRVTN